MYTPLSLLILEPHEIEETDRVIVRVDGQVLAESHQIKPNTVFGEGWGLGEFGMGVFGDPDPSVGFGMGAFGWGPFGFDDPVLVIQTSRRFIADDYSVELALKDFAGNIGAWSDARVIEHRPLPAPPYGLKTQGGILTWKWSDLP